MPWCESCNRVVTDSQHFLPDGSCEGDRAVWLERLAWEDWLTNQNKPAVVIPNVDPRLRDAFRKRLQQFSVGGGERE